MASRRESDKLSSSASLVRLIEEDGSVAGDRAPALDDAAMLHLHEQMVQAREFDRRVLMLQRQGRVGFYAPSTGQEATTLGAAAALQARDWVFPAFREGAAAIMRGLTLEEAICQLMGNAGDRCKGHQMPCHFSHRESNYHAMSTVVGTQISHAVGAAMAAKIRGDDVVVLGFLGDGATSANDFHCGLNFAALRASPCVLVCQNNHWASSVPVSKQSSSETVAQKGRAYGMPFVRVDGNDVLAVWSVTKQCVDRARAGEGPTFVEAVTYRRGGHTASDDPTRYRDRKEVESWERRDPIDRFRRHLVWRGLWDDGQEKELAGAMARRINEAITAAEAHGPPAAETLIEDVFAEVTPQLREQFGRLPASEASDAPTSGT